MITYLVVVIVVIGSLLLFAFWHLNQSGTAPFGLCSECH